MKDNNVSLYVVATPIGNLNDISPRALEVLGAVDFVAAEDTRTSGVLLSHYHIKKHMVSHHEHNAAESGEMIVRRLLAGETCALVSDAGMPAVSDPGQTLVDRCHEAGLTVSVIPGACAAVSALALSGLPSRRFCFEGFCEGTASAKKAALEALKSEPRTMIFYEAPHRLAKTLALMAQAFGPRRVAVVREMTKVYEECVRTTLDKAAAFYAENEPRGEFVLVVEGADDTPESLDEEALKQRFYAKMAEGLSRSAAARALAAETGMAKRDIYERFKDDGAEED